jgi:hypothetical protein
MKHYFCIANDPDGIEITPRSLSRVRQGKYCVPDCVDYESKFNLPRRLKTKEVYTGWNCHNCKFLKEKTAGGTLSENEAPLSVTLKKEAG